MAGSNTITGGKLPSVILHSCCGPCSTYCIETLAKEYSVTVFYYNPNIYPDEEYMMRVREQERFIKEFPVPIPVSFIEGDFEKDRFYSEVAAELEDEPERGRRCVKCFRLRLMETGKKAKELGADYFATTLTISPQKDIDLINSIGNEVAEELGITYMPTAFRKKNGYKRSCELSREYGMYRQDYCGCVYSMRKD